MLQRSVVRRGLTVLVAAAAWAGPAAGAQAAQIPVPRDAPVVAGPTADGLTLRAFVAHGRLCTLVDGQAGEYGQGADGRRHAVDPEQDCRPIPVLGPFGHQTLGSGGGETGGASWTAGASGAQATAVELRRRGATVAHADAATAALPGAAAELRFFLLEAPPGARPDELAVLDATGTVRRAADADLNLSEDASAGRLLARGHQGAQPWSLRSRIDHPLAPTPLEPERRETAVCLTYAAGQSSQSLCAGGREAGTPMTVLPAVDCAPYGNAVIVLTQPTVRRVVVVLGDGRRRAVALRTVPGDPAATRAGVLITGTGMSVRRVIALGRSGAALATETLALAPAPARGGCDAILTTQVRSAAAGGAPPAGPAPHTLTAADDGVRLCLGVDAPPRVPQDCALPPLEAGETFLARKATQEGRLVFGLVPEEVATVRLLLDDGTTQDAGPAPIPGYTGRYAAVARAVAAEVAGTRRVVGYRQLDARGRALEPQRIGPELPAVRQATALAPAPGVPRLFAAVLPKAGTFGPFLCLGTTPQGRGDGCRIATTGQFTVTAQCAPRRILVTGLLPHPTDRLVLRTAGGRDIAAHSAAVPAALRRAVPRAAKAAAAVGTVPGGAGLRELIVRGPGGARVALALPPAARQCGYAMFPDLSGGGFYLRAWRPRAG